MVEESKQDRSDSQGTEEKNESMRDAILARQKEVEEAAARGSDNAGSNGKITSDFVRRCLKAQELGDGILYSAVNKGKYVFNQSAGEWLEWTGHYWRRDYKDGAYYAVENVVDKYLHEALKIQGEINQAYKEEQKSKAKELRALSNAIYGRVDKLRKDAGRNAAVKFARSIEDALVITGEDLDQNPWLLACKNGVLDLKTGRFHEGQPDQYITKACPTEWKGLDESAEPWEKVLLEVFDQNQALVDYFQRLVGYGITGLTVEPVFPVFYGRGRNGKDMIVKVLMSVLGNLAGSIPSEMLLSQRHDRSAAGPTPDIMGLKGLRLAFASETDEGQRFSAARVKWLTGGGQLVGRNPHDRYQVRFYPTHLVILLTNSKPSVSPNDFAFWERTHLVPFTLSFVDREPVAKHERRAIKGLADQLADHASGILAWMVKGCFEYQKMGLAPPETITEATKEYRRDEDILADFLEEHCIIKEGTKEKASDIYDRFLEWFQKNVSKKGLSQKKFGHLMSFKFEKSKSSGITVYHGVELRPNID